MKSIEIDDDLYHFIASNTQHIGESASDILRRLVMPGTVSNQDRQINEVIAPSPDSAIESASKHVVCQAGAVLEEISTLSLGDIPKVVDKWLLVLSIMHKHHEQQFSKVLGMSGRNRTYFAKDKDTLLATGSSTNPKNVPDTVFWVITNNSTAKKVNMLKEVAEVMGFNLAQTNTLINAFIPQGC